MTWREKTISFHENVKTKETGWIAIHPDHSMGGVTRVSPIFSNEWCVKDHYPHAYGYKMIEWEK